MPSVATQFNSAEASFITLTQDPRSSSFAVFIALFRTIELHVCRRFPLHQAMKILVFKTREFLRPRNLKKENTTKSLRFSIK